MILTKKNLEFETETTVGELKLGVLAELLERDSSWHIGDILVVEEGGNLLNLSYPTIDSYSEMGDGIKNLRVRILGPEEQVILTNGDSGE